MTPGGSLSTPAVIGNGGARSAVDDGSSKVDRFKFDLASTGKYLNEQHHHVRNQRATIDSERRINMNANDVAACCDDVRTMKILRGSHGKLHHQISHTSCNSLGQNISTSDQQPLIVDGHHNSTATDYRCAGDHHYCRHTQPLQPHCSAGGGGGEQCCLRTTSFMFDSAPKGTCTCCISTPDQAAPPTPPPPLPRLHRSFSRGASNEHLSGSLRRRAAADDEDDSDDGDDPYDRNERKSRTLTRIYKPLNDLDFPNSSAKNLIDNFCLPVSAGNLNSTFATDHL